ncbi:MAG: cyclic lactone autoinducer peptide [Lachnospiraceae bacterium]|nr:cyclic lactone autoinducer peptide [Lachnospiraceae bacterium]
MKVAKILNKKVTACTNALAKKMVAQNANSTCVWLAYQPTLPEEAEKFRKKK